MRHGAVRIFSKSSQPSLREPDGRFKLQFESCSIQIRTEPPVSMEMGLRKADSVAELNGEVTVAV